MSLKKLNKTSISITWNNSDVLFVREDLTQQQASEVLEEVLRRHDASIGVNWDIIEAVADDMFPMES